MSDVWKPFPKQEIALSITTTEAIEILFGGARGPGKTDAGIIWLLGPELSEDSGKLYIDHPKYRALVLRRDYGDLVDWIDRASYLYRGYGAVIVGNPAEIRWPSGAKFRLGHLKDRKSYEKYLGHEYQRELIEELTLIKQENYYISILGSLRSTYPELKPQIFNTTNPGGVGHAWVKKRFIDPSAYGKSFLGEDGRKRIYIPGTIEDNPILLLDVNYVQYLEGLKATNPELYKAWRLGDWDIFAGQVFSEFSRNLHVIKPYLPKREFAHFIWIDWGYSGKETDQGAFAAYAAALIKGKHMGETFNRVIVYKEWYGKHKAPDVWAEMIYNDTKGRLYRESVGDSSMFNPKTDGSTPIAELMERRWNELHAKFWLKMYPGTKNRIERVTTLHNWLQIAPDGLPYLLITDNCEHLVRTLPELVYDEVDLEDVDTSLEDHPYDALTYGLARVKFIPAKIGAMDKLTERQRGRPAPIMALDLEEFESAKSEKKRDWRAI